MSLIEAAVQKQGHCVLGLSGGSTPVPIYAALGQAKTIDWSNVWIYLIDERYVPSHHPDSNQKMIRETLLSHADIPEDQIYFPDTSMQLVECVSDYEQRLKECLRIGSTNILVLGMGEDGHIASLFPPVPQAAFGDHLVIHTETDTFAVRDRISVTMPVLEAAISAVFLLKGEKKQKTWQQMMKSHEDEKRWPAKAILERSILFSDWE